MYVPKVYHAYLSEKFSKVLTWRKLHPGAWVTKYGRPGK